MGKTEKKRMYVLALLFAVIVLGIVLVVAVRKANGSFGFGREAGAKGEKLSEIDLDSLENYKIMMAGKSHDIQKGVCVIDKPEVVEQVIQSLDSLYVRECDSTPYRIKGAKGLVVKVVSEDVEAADCSIEILGKNENGNYVLGLMDEEDAVVEVVEGDLDYEYLKELYDKEVKKNGETLGKVS